jgi:hypothetical protein
MLLLLCCKGPRRSLSGSALGVFMCVYACMNVYVYIYTHTYTHTYIHMYSSFESVDAAAAVLQRTAQKPIRLGARCVYLCICMYYVCIYVGR